MGLQQEFHRSLLNWVWLKAFSLKVKLLHSNNYEGQLMFPIWLNLYSNTFQHFSVSLDSITKHEAMRTIKKCLFRYLFCSVCQYSSIWPASQLLYKSNCSSVQMCLYVGTPKCLTVLEFCKEDILRYHILRQYRTAVHVVQTLLYHVNYISEARNLLIFSLLQITDYIDVAYFPSEDNSRPITNIPFKLHSVVGKNSSS